MRGPKGIVTVKGYKLIPEGKVPAKIRPATDRWLQVFQSIPKGQVMETSEQELGITSVYARVLIAKLNKLGLLHGIYFVTTRKQSGKEVIYIVHSSKDAE